MLPLVLADGGSIAKTRKRKDTYMKLKSQLHEVMEIGSGSGKIVLQERSARFRLVGRTP